MRTKTGGIGRGLRGTRRPGGRRVEHHAARQALPLATAALTRPEDAAARVSACVEPPETAGPRFKYRKPAGAGLSSLPSLPPARPSHLAGELAPMPELPSWSPLTFAVPLFVAVWVCFAALAGSVTVSPDADIAGLDHILSLGAAVVALVLVTLSVAHTQSSGLRPRPAAVAVVGLGAAQGLVASAIGSGPSDLWGVGGQVFVLIGVTVPLAWVGGQFQSCVRRQRVERNASLIASWMERVRHQASETVDSVQRHDIRSMLFVIDGAARALTDPGHPLADDQRAGFAALLTEGVERLGLLTEVRGEEIQPVAVAGLARAVVHAERKAGRTVKATLPDGLTAVGRAADVAAVVRTLVDLVARRSPAGVQVSTGVDGGAIVVRVEPAGAGDLPLLLQSWEQVCAGTFKSPRSDDDTNIDLFVATRLLAEQGADLWSTADQRRFAVRLKAAPDSGTERET